MPSNMVAVGNTMMALTTVKSAAMPERDEI
jgi:hypothetical protein